jgi:TolB-like protein
MRFLRWSLALALLAAAASPLEAQRSVPSAEAIAKLEAERTRRPQNVAALRALGVAYYRAKRFGDARTVLDQARRLDPKDGVSALYAGLSAEALGDLTHAKAAYNAYLSVGRTRKVKNEIQARLVALAREEALAAARAAVANEARLSQTPGSPRTIAVPPLTFSGTDSSLKPLERGMADLMITDLSRSAQLTVVERDRMQALADEIRLSAAGAVDSSTAVRAGRLIQAGNLVNGAIVQQGSQLRMDARVVNVSSGAIGEPASVQNSLDALFAMEKQLVFQVFDRLGVTLTPAERQLVERRPTQNMEAFLAYSRGLMALDDGRFQDATRFFDNARTLDPGFGAAAARYQAVQAAAASGDASASSIEASATGTAELRTVDASVSSGSLTTTDALSTTLSRTASDLNPSTATEPVATTSADRATTLAVSPTPTPTRDPTTTTTNIDRPAPPQGTVTIIIRRP